MKDEFGRFHPIVNLIFYVVVLGITMFQMQIGMVLISLLWAGLYYFWLKGKKGIRYFLLVCVIVIFSAVINPLFSHKGSTLLFYMFTGNPVTLESIVYGIVAATIIGIVLLWFSTFNQVINAEKLLAAIGKAMPHVALLITMIMRFIPKYSKYQREVAQINKCNEKSKSGKIKDGFRNFSITTTWALETSIYTADSMKARGFGAKRRTSYSNYKMETRDWVLIWYILVLAAVVITGLATDRMYTYYYPYFVIKNNAIGYICYNLLCMIPILINIREEIRWHRLKSKI